MANKATSDAQGLESTRAWCIAVIRAMNELSPSDLFASAEAGVDTAFQRADQRGLKMVVRDLREWVSGFAPGDQEKIDHSLRRQLGRGLWDEG